MIFCHWWKCPRSKTKTVMKSVDKLWHFGSMHQNKNHPIGGWVYKFYQLKPVIFWGGSLNHQGSRHLVSLTINSIFVLRVWYCSIIWDWIGYCFLIKFKSSEYMSAPGQCCRLRQKLILAKSYLTKLHGYIPTKLKKNQVGRGSCPNVLSKK